MEGESGAADAKEETAKRHTYALIRVSDELKILCILTSEISDVNYLI